MTGRRIIGVSQIVIGLLFANLVVILGPVHLLIGAALLIFGGALTLVWPASRISRTIVLAGALALGCWSTVQVLVGLGPPLVFVVVPMAAASIVMACILGRGRMTRGGEAGGPRSGGEFKEP